VVAGDREGIACNDFSGSRMQAQLAALAKKKKRVADFHEDMEHLNVVFIGHVGMHRNGICLCDQ
jgi:hypothetical protein